MKFQLDERLKEYMKETNQKDILISTLMCHTWGGSRLEISARFVDPYEAESLKSDHFVSYPHEFGEVLIRRKPQKFAETIQLGLSRFFKRITVEGIYSV